MAIRCPQCGLQHDAAMLENNVKGVCRCGYSLDISLIQSIDDFLRFCESEEERKKAKVIQRESEKICRMILDEGCLAVDIEIAKRNLEEKVRHLFPDKLSTYRMIYEARFKRLWEQFRSSS
ncbi:MAG: hypothetical protein JW893_07735 [Candidatus Omnitrophica bacterium]|nr:hypothetical protein [Candidatus Omnitrophota bacterium]